MGLIKLLKSLPGCTRKQSLLRTRHPAAVAVILAALLCSSCSSANGTVQPQAPDPPGQTSGGAQPQTQTGSADVPPASVDPSASLPSPSNSDADPAAAAPFAHIQGVTTVTDRDKYSFSVTFDATIVSSSASEDAASAKPGQANVKWSTSARGYFTLTNTTPRHTFPVPDEFTTVCTLSDGNCPTLYGFYPSSSPVCTVKGADGRTGFGTAKPAFGPPGDWCAVAFSDAPFGTLQGYGGTVLPVGGTVSTHWEGLSAAGVLGDDGTYPALASTLAVAPNQWAIESPTWTGETTPVTPAGCGVDMTFVLWSSSPVVCRLLS